MSNTQLRTLAKALVDKLDLIEKDGEYQTVWTIYHTRGRNYRGPTHEHELDALRDHLKMTTTPELDPEAGPLVHALAKLHMVHEADLKELHEARSKLIKAKVTEDRLKDYIETWRDRHDTIVDLFEKSQDAVLRALCDESVELDEDDQYTTKLHKTHTYLWALRAFKDNHPADPCDPYLLRENCRVVAEPGLDDLDDHADLTIPPVELDEDWLKQQEKIDNDFDKDTLFLEDTLDNEHFVRGNPALVILIKDALERRKKGDV